MLFLWWGTAGKSVSAHWKQTLIGVLSMSDRWSEADGRYWSEHSLHNTPKFQGLLESSSSCVSDRYSTHTGQTRLISGSFSHYQTAVAMWGCQVITSKIRKLKKKPMVKQLVCLVPQLTVSCPLSTQVRTCKLRKHLFGSPHFEVSTFCQPRWNEFLDTKLSHVLCILDTMGTPGSLFT